MARRSSKSQHQGKRRTSRSMRANAPTRGVPMDLTERLDAISAQLASTQAKQDDCINLRSLDAVTKIEKRATQRQLDDISDNMSNAIHEMRIFIRENKKIDRSELIELFEYLVRCYLRSGLRDKYAERNIEK